MVRNTFITVVTATNQIRAIQQTAGRLPKRIVGVRHVVVPTVWFGQIFSNTERFYDLVEPRVASDKKISLDRSFKTDRLIPVDPDVDLDA